MDVAYDTENYNTQNGYVMRQFNIKLVHRQLLLSPNMKQYCKTFNCFGAFYFT